MGLCKPGHSTLLSMSSHSNAKNPVTHVPLQSSPPLRFGGFLLLTLGFLVVFLLTGGGGFEPLGMKRAPPGASLSSYVSLETQHRRLDLQRSSTLRMASQNPERRSATHTPGHVSVGFRGRETKSFKFRAGARGNFVLVGKWNIRRSRRMKKTNMEMESGPPSHYAWGRISASP